MAENKSTTEIATLGGGCFWCLEAVFEQLKGVLSVESGYAGGTTPKPTYRDVCSGTTGHAEVVRVTFDSSIVGYADVLNVFFSIHDPTTRNRQGNDVGTQYRSVIFYHTPEQKQIADAKIAELNGSIFDNRIVTELVPYTGFAKAEDYHQGYFRDNPVQPYCQFVVSPKVAKFRKQFAHRLKN